LGTDRTCPQIGTALKTGTPYWFGDPRIGLGRDLSKFQFGESPNQFGVHSNLGTNIYSVFQYQACVNRTQAHYDRSHVLLTEMLQTEAARAILSVECNSAVENFSSSKKRVKKQLLCKDVTAQYCIYPSLGDCRNSFFVFVSDSRCLASLKTRNLAGVSEFLCRK